MKRIEIKKRPMADTVLASLEPEDKEYRELDGNSLCTRRTAARWTSRANRFPG